MMKNILMEIKNLGIIGNVIDNGWIENLKYENGKPNMNAIMILSEIIYWYRPTEMRDEVTGAVIGYKKKFKADKLQKSYESLGERFGISKRQAKAAIDFLIEKNLINREFRTITIGEIVYNNVMFLEPEILEIKKITGVNRFIEDETFIEKDMNENTLLQSNVGGVIQSNVPPSYNQMYHPPTIECKTNTKTTTEITTEITKSSSSTQSNWNKLTNIYFELFEKKLTPYMKTKINIYIEKTSLDFVIAILEYCIEHNAKTHSYFFKTLDNLIKRNIKTITDLEVSITKFNKDIENKKKITNRSSSSNKNNNSKTINFTNYSQREYDYDALEKQLLGWDD
ncbi:DnaD domain protein [Clostridium tarantellae]|uniref:DnaB/C C-terminal domain-containing protein n=1 Tax=Clostridium tarantellae TaxID=39493 RepID=A0A6I1MIV5_9CLOT|nr:DnaD domain protein [Clostridium tarantellae]MPQ42854.1 hypothetical protein [Clostridium tarantellae]